MNIKRIGFLLGVRYKLYILLLFLILVAYLSACRSTNFIANNDYSVRYNIPISFEREMRGIWIATVANIDWPINPADTEEKKYNDFIKILDFYKSHNFNAIFLQIRTAGDAFYDSKYAPWSIYLTGKEGKKPISDVNNLKNLIETAHSSGMEFHAWVNPLRATYNLKIEELDSLHDFHQHPEWMVKYGKKYYYNPGIPEVRKRVVDVCAELLQNYDIDGIHFDDYFYPYKIKGIEFDDNHTFESHAGNYDNIHDWRRNNINTLVADVYSEIQKIKPWIHFGISPFGVWRNKSMDKKGSDTRAGQTSYDNVYADPLYWIEHKSIDYIVPQVYWSMKYPAASYVILVDWWNEQNFKKANLYVGHAAYKVKNNADKAWKRKKELLKQIKYGKQTLNVKGGLFFSSNSLLKKNTKVAKQIKKKVYNKRVLVPPKYNAKLSVTDSPVVNEIITTKASTSITLSNIPDDARFLVFLTAKSEQDFRTGKYKIVDISFINRDSIVDNHYNYTYIHDDKYFKHKYQGILYLDIHRQVSMMTLFNQI